MSKRKYVVFIGLRVEDGYVDQLYKKLKFFLDLFIKLTYYQTRADVQWVVLLMTSFNILRDVRNPGFIQENETAYGAEEIGWRDAKAVATTLSGLLFIEAMNGFESMILGIICRRLLLLRKILDEEYSGRKGFELTSFLERRLCIFWDMKSSPLPTNVNPEDIVKKIKAFVKRETNNNWEAVDVYAYGHSSAQQNTKLQYSGVTLIYTSRGRKDTMYIALLVDLFKRSRVCPPPSSIMLITGNIYYAKALHALGLLGHKIILPDDNFWPWSNLVKREDLVATSSSQFEELSRRCKEFDLFIFWDLENCPIPREVPAEDVRKNILKFVRGKIDRRAARIHAYADFSLILDGAAVRKFLEESGVNVIDTPHVKKDAADEAMMIDLFMYSKLVPSPFPIMVITGDVDFATTLHALAGFGHDIYLAIPSRPRIDVSKSLTSAAKDYWSWSDVVNGRRIN